MICDFDDTIHPTHYFENLTLKQAQNPKTLEPVDVPAKRTVKFKMGRIMRQKLNGQL